jgi:hypothetical protein
MKGIGSVDRDFWGWVGLPGWEKGSVFIVNLL